MAQQVKIPPAGESITSATVARWHVADGATVKRGELLATIETDKVSNELESDTAGTLKILVQEGEEVAIGTVIAEIDGGTETIAAAEEVKPAAEEPAAEEPAAEEPAAEEPAAEEPAAVAAEGPEPAEDREPAPMKRPEAGGGEIYLIKVPAAGESITSATIAQWHKRDGEAVRQGETLVTLETDKVSNELEAELEGLLEILTPEGAEVEIGTVIGQVRGSVGVPPASQAGEREARPPTPVPAKESGGEGEETIAKEDAGPVSPETATAGTPASPMIRPDLAVVADTPRREVPARESGGRTTRKRLSTIRRKIATQLVNAQQSAAILTTFNEADMSRVMRVRKQVQEDFVARHGVKLGFMSFFVKAVVLALKEVTVLNSRLDGDELVENHFYDIGVAVGTEKGLVVPVIRDADQKSFAEIEQDILAYAMKARDGKIQLEDMRGGCFTISNGGVYGSLLSTPIINPPQSGILGMHTIQQRPVAVDGQVEIRPMMYLALSYDHRVVDGKGAVTFLIRIKEAIENPTRLMLEI